MFSSNGSDQQKEIEDSEVYKQAKDVRSSISAEDKSIKPANYLRDLTEASEDMWRSKSVDLYECYKRGKAHAINKDFTNGLMYITDVNEMLLEYIKSELMKNPNIHDKSQRAVRVKKLGDVLEGMIDLLEFTETEIDKPKFTALISGYATGIQQQREYEDI